MQTFKLEQRYFMENSDINVVGEMLGYDWNEICDVIAKAEFYAHDGDGTFTVERDYLPENEVLNAIFTKIFADNPECNDITISD